MNLSRTSLLATSLVFLLNGCGGVSVQGIDIGRIVSAGSKAMDLGDKTEAEEIEMGDRIAELMLEKAPIADDDQLQAYVNRVGYWLVRHSDRPHLPWHFVVLNNPAANAFAAPGGYIFVTTGLLDQIHNEAELAGVLAHEIAHVEQRHHLNALAEKSSSGLLSDLLVLAHESSKDAEERDNDSTRFTGHYDQMVLDVYNRGLDRDDELQADQHGAMMAARAGYDHYGFASVLQNLQGDSDDRSLAGFLKRHPAIGDRLQKLEPTLMHLDEQSISYRVLAGRYTHNSRIALPD